MTGKTLYDKLWDPHVVRQEEDGTCLLYIDRHLMHEVTSPQAFEGLRLAQRKVWRSESIVAVPDHNTPTKDWDLGITDPVSKLQVDTLHTNILEFGALVYFPFKHKNQGIIHVIAPENGAILPGMTVVCGDSHTATHGAFGALAHGIGTSEVEHVLATQTLVQKKSKAMQVKVEGALGVGVGAKDVALAIIGIPVVVRTTEDMLNLVPNGLREAAAALAPFAAGTNLDHLARCAAAADAGSVLAVARREIDAELQAGLAASRGDLRKHVALAAAPGAVPDGMPGCLRRPKAEAVVVFPNHDQSLEPGVPAAARPLSGIKGRGIENGRRFVAIAPLLVDKGAHAEMHERIGRGRIPQGMHARRQCPVWRRG